MILTIPKRDIITITDKEFDSVPVRNKKIHIIQIEFLYPTKQKLDWLIKTYHTTNRFIVTNNIKFYNWYFKQNFGKKFYVENKVGDGLISFFKKNNKVLLNITNLDEIHKQFILSDNVFNDIIKNVEVIKIEQSDFDNKIKILSNWSGNVIIKKQ